MSANAGLAARARCTKRSTASLRARSSIGRGISGTESGGLRLIAEGIAQATWETDAEGQIATDSPSWRTYTGQTFQEWLGRGAADAIHPEDREAVQKYWYEAIAARGPIDAEFRLRHAASGGWRWTNVRASPLLNDDGSVRKWVGMNIDIDDRKRAEATLRASEERQAFLLKFYLRGTLYCSDRLWLDYRLHDEACTATVTRNGMRHQVRRHCLEWFETYLSGTPYRHNLAVRRALFRALRPYRYPRLTGVGRKLKAVAARMRSGATG